MTDRPSPVAHQDGFNGVFPVVVDLSMTATTQLPALKKLGVKVIIRYFALKAQGD